MSVITPNQLLFLLTLPPEKAIQFFERKGYALSWDWKETWQEAHSKAFTVAKVMKLDILQDLRNEVDRAIKTGVPFNEWQKDVAFRMKLRGWWGKVRADQVPGFDPASGVDPAKMVQLGSPRRLKIIYKTNMRVAHSAGRYKGMLDFVQFSPYWQYLQVQRPTMRHDHHLLHEKVFRWDDPIWDTAWPPNGFGCLCTVRQLSKLDLERKGLKVSRGTDIKGFTPGEGWAYNPAKASFTPDESKYHKDLIEEYKT